ncbi:hypothetical protein [Paraglaciecola sp.]|uniref:hypothetical protein n=1 Tax=Paraglaciecola sp. TaxID=1920173 RepID=UPI003EF45995
MDKNIKKINSSVSGFGPAVSKAYKATLEARCAIIAFGGACKKESKEVKRLLDCDSVKQ